MPYIQIKSLAKDNFDRINEVKFRLFMTAIGLNLNDVNFNATEEKNESISMVFS